MRCSRVLLARVLVAVAVVWAALGLLPMPSYRSWYLHVAALETSLGPAGLPCSLAWSHAHPLRPDIVHGPASLESYLGGPPARRADAYRLASPLAWAGRSLPPTLLIHGSADRLVSAQHAQRLAAGLSARGRSVRLLLIPLAEHAFDFRVGGVGEQLARTALLRFLGENLRPE